MGVTDQVPEPGLLLRSGFFTSQEGANRTADLLVDGGVSGEVLGAYTYLDPTGLSKIIRQGHGQDIAALSAAGPETLQAIADEFDRTGGEFKPHAVLVIGGAERFSGNEAANIGWLAGKGLVRQLELGVKGFLVPGEVGKGNRTIFWDSAKEAVTKGHLYIPRTRQVTHGTGDNRGSTVRAANGLAERGIRVVRALPSLELFFRGAEDLPAVHPDIVDVMIPGGHDSAQHSLRVARKIAYAMHR
jgi:hypothetical protein